MARLTNVERAERELEVTKQRIKDEGAFEGFLQGLYTKKLALQQKITDAQREGRNLANEELEAVEKLASAQAESGDAIRDAFPSFSSIAGVTGSTLESVLGMVGGLGRFTLGALAAFAVISKINEAVTDTRKELGVSYANAALITAENKIQAQIAKGFGLSAEDLSSAQAAIREDLGASVRESLNLGLSFARTAAATGQTAEQLGDTLSLMESISSASRDVLLNQIRTNAAMIEAAGVAPALVMRDIAENAEFFAQFAKDGGGNIIQAGIAARKLGLEMSAVAGITESLLDFETSIEKQMEASLLIGRQINLDKARQLAFNNDIEGVQREILKQVGGEAEFNKMNAIARKALAESVGVNVEQLSRLVRNNTAGATGAAAGAAAAGAQTTQSSDMRAHELLGKIVRNTE